MGGGKRVPRAAKSTAAPEVGKTSCPTPCPRPQPPPLLKSLLLKGFVMSLWNPSAFPPPSPGRLCPRSFPLVRRTHAHHSVGTDPFAPPLAGNILCVSPIMFGTHRKSRALE